MHVYIHIFVYTYMYMKACVCICSKRALLLYSYQLHVSHLSLGAAHRDEVAAEAGARDDAAEGGIQLLAHLPCTASN